MRNGIRGWPAAAVAVLLGACGGGGDDGPATTPTAPTTPTPTISWTAGNYSPASTFANQCQTPRTGIDPVTSRSYPDQQGSSLAEKHFLRSWTHDLYLWYGEVADRDPASIASVLDYFNTQKTTVVLPNGRARDEFHYTYDTAEYYALSESGVSVGYGINWDMVNRVPPRKLVVRYVEASSQAGMAGVMRGAEVLRIDGVDLVNDGTQAGVDKLNAALSESTQGRAHTFVFADRGTGTQRTVSLGVAPVTLDPVPVVRILNTASGDLGYVLFQDHMSKAEAELVDAFTRLRDANVKDLVLDLRYNGGGRLGIASQVAYMIAGPAQTNGKTFERLVFNDRHPTINPVTGEALQPLPFTDVTLGYSTSPGQALPALNLSRVFVLTSGDTCSASESVINGLNGIGIEVIQIGGDTCGKPYGFYPQDNCGTTYFSVQIKNVNAKGFGDYAAGFSPATRAGQPAGAKLPGCEVGDDYTHDLGDPDERMYKVALDYRARGSCELAAGSAGATGRVKAAATVGGDGMALDMPNALEPWRHNRMYP